MPIGCDRSFEVMKKISLELTLEENDLDWQRGGNDMSKETKINMLMVTVKKVHGDRKELK